MDHTMKFGSKILIFFSIFIISCSSNWVAQINGNKISLEEFNTFYYAQHRSIYNKSNQEIDKLAQDPMEVRRNPLLDREEFLSQMIKQRLVYDKAQDDKIIENDELQSLIQLQEEGLIVSYYAKKKFEDKITISEDEVAAFYQKNRQMFKGRPVEQVEEYVKNQLEQQKLQKLITDFIEDLKEESKIARNESIIKKLSDIDKSKRPKEGTVVTINGATISVKEFEKYYYTQHTSLYNVSHDEIDKLATDPNSIRRNPLLNREEFLDQLIKQKITYAKAKEEGFLDDPDLKSLLQMQKEGLVIGYYVKEKFSDEIKVTDEEISAVYQQQKSRFKGVPISRAELYIKQNILQRKLQGRIARLVDNLKEESKIEKNTKLLQTPVKSESKEKK